jgi:hypothetical protein
VENKEILPRHFAFLEGIGLPQHCDAPDEGEVKTARGPQTAAPIVPNERFLWGACSLCVSFMPPWRKSPVGVFHECTFPATSKFNRLISNQHIRWGRQP